MATYTVQLSDDTQDRTLSTLTTTHSRCSLPYNMALPLATPPNPLITVHLPEPSPDVRGKLASRFWAKFSNITAPTWPADLEQLANPHGDLRMQPPIAPDAPSLGDKLELGCYARGIHPAQLDFVTFIEPGGHKVRVRILVARQHQAQD